MKKVLIVLVITALAALAGCGKIDKVVASATGYSNHCIDGVAYIQFANGASIKYNPDGSIATC